jgi:hypothetical protein
VKLVGQREVTMHTISLATRALGEKLAERRFGVEDIPPVAPTLGSSLLGGALLAQAHQLLYPYERLHAGRIGHVVAVEEEALRANQHAQLGIEANELAGRQPVQGRRAERHVDRFHAYVLAPGRLAQVRIHPTQSPAKVAERTLPHREQHRILIHRNAARLWEARQKALAEGAGTAPQIERDKIWWQKRLQRVEHRLEALLARGYVARLLAVPAAQPLVPVYRRGFRLCHRFSS